VPRPDAAALALAQRFALDLERVPPRGPAGERLGRASGSSLEFHDRRPYQPGDDVRHLDWRALARSDQLVVRLWREEVLPRVEILVDASRSMAAEPAKAQRAVDLAALLAECAREDGIEVLVLALGARPEPVPLEALRNEGLAFDGRAPLTELLEPTHAFRRRGAVVVVLGDFLFPHDPRALVRTLAARAGTLSLVQLLTPGERAPRAGGAHRLVDVETDAVLDLVLDEPTVQGYRARLANLIDGLAAECRRAQARFTSLDTAVTLADQARTTLVPAGLLRPR